MTDRDICDACRAPVIWALNPAGQPFALDTAPAPHGDHTLYTHNGARHARKLTRNQIPGARKAGQALYQPHRASCTKALSHRR